MAPSNTELDNSALIVLVPEVEFLIGEFRRQFDFSAGDGLGAHVTILFPFRPMASISAKVISELRALFATQPRSTFSLARVGEFPSAIYLAPEPSGPFDSLMRATAARFPDCPPYRGAFPNPVPHVTVAQEPPAEDLAQVGGRIRSRVAPFLPLRCSADEVSLAVKTAGRWSIAEQFALGPG